MMVPRAYRYSAAASPKDLDEKEVVRRKRPPPLPKVEAKKPAIRPTSPARTNTAPPRTPTPAVDVPERSHTPESKRLPAMQSRKTGAGSSRDSAHDPNALPPSVAALLAVTQIPRPRPGQFKRRPAASRRISIDELVNEWKSEESLKSNLSSSPALSMLLEDQDEGEEQNNTTEDDYMFARSTSVESIPSLEDDDRSILSNGSLPTPESLRSRKSISNLRKEKVARSLPASVECASSHPLVPQPLHEDSDPDDALLLTPTKKTRPPPKPKSSFKSNLTTSFQALKNAISTFSLSSAPTQQQSQSSPSSPLSAEMLWSHPFLFPRFSPEIRPAFQGIPTQAQRRYLNPMPLTFEEQETPYQLALHAPYLEEQTSSSSGTDADSAPTIPLQTYTRGRRKPAASPKRSGSATDPNSEAGRALQAAGAGVRQREPRENSDFLRVVVLEMNMRRGGKLEYGRAKIWLPPRQVSPSGRGMERARGRVPTRWVGVSAY